MECKYAYKKTGVQYILCKCLGEPQSVKMADTAHYMCGHQRFCQKIQDCSLLPSWTECKVRKMAEAKAKAELTEVMNKAAEAKVKRESRRRKKV